MNQGVKDGWDYQHRVAEVGWEASEGSQRPALAVCARSDDESNYGQLYIRSTNARIAYLVRTKSNGDRTSPVATAAVAATKRDAQG